MTRKGYIVIGLLATIFMGCANRGIGPQGGPRDSIPPVLVSMFPEDGTTHFSAKRIELQFDEYLQLDNVAENVLLSPPTKQPPEVRAVGKRVFVNFLDTLRDSTTYTIEFGDAICDFNEKVPIHGFSYSFSTGDFLDSLEISGRVINSADLNPISGIVVGLHRCLDDSALSTMQFDNIAKTDSVGAFVIHNVRQGSYRIYALGDISRDYIYQPGEGLAFNDSVWQTTLDIQTISDTIWKDSIAEDSTRLIDTIVSRTRIVKGPDDVELFYFKENKTRLYFQRAYREEAHALRFLFVGKQDIQPSFRVLRPSEVDSSFRDSSFVDWMPYTRWSYCPTNDTILCWLTDSIAIKQDSLFAEVTYLKTDSVYNIQTVKDTLRCIYRAPKLTEKVLATRARQAANRKVEIKCNANGKFGVDQPVILTMSMPLDSLCKDSITLWEKIDTTYKPLAFDLLPLDSARLRYQIDYPWQSLGAYEIRIDSFAVVDIYGKTNKASKVQFSIRSIEEYANLAVTLERYDSSMILQVLNDKGEPLTNCQAWRIERDSTRATLHFKNLEPKSYYLRLFMDYNGDSLWTTGDWIQHRQPEPVYYYSKKLQFKANWDFEETWDYTATPQLEGKPKELIKDAAKEKK